MNIERRAVLPLRICLVVLFAVLLLLEVMSLPGQFAHMAETNPESAYLRWPLTAVSIYWVVCIQVVVVATWKLLSLVESDRIFTDASLTWVDMILGAIVAAWAVLVVVLALVGFTADDPGLPLLLFVVVVIITVAALLMVVLRALLRQATGLRSEMDTVV
ncbi:MULTISPECIES: DUF2975 domain-containing protein [Dietzia]|uniref:DUF2975 domain-containing protein n=1 Tax=Dietzia TaxID=37914 RepID=UPI0007844B5F|nr:MULTISPECIES: DUF2975 domain-containing protein [Dietzia]KZO59506.1 hypothetical protein A2U19_06530 [Dietzia maris]MCT2121357.1 DUF2975 domain-containing protein [Dietzia cinnamea]MCT2145524.1 DUF2975 domain-containing protein [Dietzia cinnamea]MCT2305110.1 DUF2975 domain-containing protein [Dietzia cinnamea]